VKIFFKKIIAVGILFFPLMTFAGDWKIIPKESSITFTATQNNSPVLGKFTDFNGDIHFDPAQLKTSHVRIVVNMASVTTDYADIADTLKLADWFDIKTYPQAIFTTSDFVKKGDKSYQANGILTIRDKAIPVMMTFTLDEFTQNKAHAEGSVELKRLAFGVGQGEWKKTDNIKDEVKVNFVVNANASQQQDHH